MDLIYEELEVIIFIIKVRINKIRDIFKKIK